MARKNRHSRVIPHTLRDLLIYMRVLRRRGHDNYLLGKLAPGERAEGVVKFLLEKGYRVGLKEHVDTIIVSDIHFGSKHSLADGLREALSQFTFKRLILNGDIFDRFDVELKDLQPSHIEFLQELDNLSTTHEVVWIEGNHDQGLADILTHVPVHTEYEWEYGGKRYLALHGDKFDRFYHEHPLLYTIGTEFYTFLQSLGPSTRRVCAFLKRKTKWYTSAITMSTQGALAYAKERNMDYVMCGHTHHVYQEADANTSYYNSGGWTESPCHFITVSEVGVRVHAFTAKGERLGVAFAS